MKHRSDMEAVIRTECDDAENDRIGCHDELNQKRGPVVDIVEHAQQRREAQTANPHQ